MTTEFGNAVVRKIAWRTVPLLSAVYFIAFLDRVNIGFAALTMNAALNITPELYGLAAGVFFLGYVLFQVPSNIVLSRLGAPAWLPVIILLWGVISMGMAFVTGAQSLMVARFFLGVAEAGFLPGVMFYLTTWFPRAYRARVISGVLLAFPLSNVLGAPVSGIIVASAHGWLGLDGWQWLFIIEGAPALAGAAAILLWLPKEPGGVDWLNEKEKAWLASELAAADTVTPHQAPSKRSVLGTIRHPVVLILAVTYLAMQLGQYGIVLWLPLIVKESGVSIVETGFLSAIPYVFAGLAMLYWSSRADRAAQDSRFLWVPNLAAAVALVTSAYMPTLTLKMIFMVIATAGIIAPLPTFWAFASRPVAALLPGVGIAMINATGTFGGFAGPYIIGYVRQTTQSFQLGLITVAFFLGLAALILFTIGRRWR